MTRRGSLNIYTDRKEVECLDCLATTFIPKWIPIRHSNCKECGSKRIKLYKPRKSKEANR